jgi:hypothetical protein
LRLEQPHEDFGEKGRVIARKTRRHVDHSSPSRAFRVDYHRTADDNGTAAGWCYDNGTAAGRCPSNHRGSSKAHPRLAHGHLRRRNGRYPLGRVPLYAPVYSR